MSYIPSMEWEVEFTSEFEDWWNGLSEDEQADVNDLDQAFRVHTPI
jgi:hypothetical protein